MMRMFLVLALATSSVALVAPRSPKPNIPSKDFIREAEIKHGRVALLSGGVLSGLLASGVEHPTQALESLPPMVQLMFFSAIGLAEAAVYLPRLSTGFSLKDGIEPGKMFARISATQQARDVELVVTRLAMIAVFAFMLHDVSSS